MLTYTRHYMISAIEGTPLLLQHLLRDVPKGDRIWDRRPDPERFTIREILAHLADWDGIFLQRLQRMRDETEPSIPDLDEEKLAQEHDYAHSDPQKSLDSLRASRQELASFLRALPEAAWTRIGQRTIGPMSLEEQVAIIAFHDSYHAHQITEFLSAHV